MFVDRLVTLARRRFSASRLGIPYHRASTFILPGAVQLGTTEVKLRLPAELGVRVAFVEVLLDDCYHLRQIARELCEPECKHIIDIGANVGLFGLAARKAFPSSIIHAYEPNNALEPYLSYQAQNVGFDYFLEAVGQQSGLVCLDIDPLESVHTSSRIDPAGITPQITLRTAIERIGGTVDLIKMDCEGAEWELLEHPDNWQGVRLVTMEHHLRSGLDHGSVGAALAHCGFRVVHQRRIDNYGLVLARR